MQGREIEELDQIRVLEDFAGLGMVFPQRKRELGRRQDDAFEQGPGELALQLPLAPPLADGDAQVKLAFLLAFAAAHNEQVVGPGQFSHQWCEFWSVAVVLEELPHPPEVANREPGPPRMSPLNVIGEGADRALAPARGGDLPADVLAELPVEVDQRRVGGGNRLGPCGLDEGQNFVELGLRRRCRAAFLDGGGFRGRLPGHLAHAGSSDWASKAAIS